MENWTSAPNIQTHSLSQRHNLLKLIFRLHSIDQFCLNANRDRIKVYVPSAINKNKCVRITSTLEIRSRTSFFSLLLIYIHKNQLNRQNFYLIRRLESIRSTEQQDREKIYRVSLLVHIQNRYAEPFSLRQPQLTSSGDEKETEIYIEQKKKHTFRIIY